MELINARNNLKNSLKKHRLEKLGIAQYWEPITSSIADLENTIQKVSITNENALHNISNKLMLTLPNGDKLAIDKPFEENNVPEENKKLWEYIQMLPNIKNDNGTLRWSEEKNGNRFYQASNRTLVINNKLVLTSTDGERIKLNAGLVELFLKSKPHTGYIKKEDVNTYRKFLNDIEVKLSMSTKKQKLLDAFLETSTGTGLNTIILPDDSDKLKDRLQVLLAAGEEGHNNIFDEANEILKLLLDKKIISVDNYKKYLKKILNDIN